jgi:hypothetical protein
MIGAGEVLVVGLVAAALYALLTPLRRRLERWIAGRLGSRPVGRSGRVVVLPRRSDGTYGREDRERHDS